MVENRIVRRPASAGIHTEAQPVRRFPPELTVAELRARNAAFTREQRIAIVTGQLIESIAVDPEGRARTRLLGEVARPEATSVATGAQGTTLDDLLGDAHRKSRPVGVSIVEQLANLTVHDVVTWARALGRLPSGSRRPRPAVFGEAPVTSGVESRSALAEGSF